MARNRGTVGSKRRGGVMAANAAPVFAREVEPGVFVYSLDHRLPVATRKLVAEMVDAGAASTRQAAQAFRQAIAARRNGDQS